MAGEALDIFISYSRRDEALKDELVNFHLKRLQQEGKIRTWQDRDIEAGAEWATEIKANLEKADIVLLLTTSSFLVSEYCYETEMKRAIQRHYEGTAKVIPIILKPCTWEDSPFSQLQVLPQDGKPITRWEDRDEAFVNVEKGIRRVVDALNAERQQAEAAKAWEAEELKRQQEEAARLERERLERERLAAEQRQEQARLEQESLAAEQRQREQAEAQQREQERLEQERQEQDRLAAEQRQQEQAEAQRIEQVRQQQEAQKQQDAGLCEQDQPRQQDADNQDNVQDQDSSSTADGGTAATSDKPEPLINKMTMWEIPLNRRSTLWWLAGGGGLLIWGATSTGGVSPSDPEPPESEPPSAPPGTGGDSSNPGRSDSPPIVGEMALKLQSFSFPVVSLNAQGKEISRVQKQNKYFVEDLGQGIGLDMVAIPGGSFRMGSPVGEGYDTEKPQHQVTVKPFYLGKFAVTQAQWKVVAAMPQVQRKLELDPISFFNFNLKGPMRPVVRVSWDEAVEFCQRLSLHTKRDYRLPSEAEWEYACRATTTTPFHFGPTITTDVANYRGTDWEYDGNTSSGNYGQGPKGIFRAETTDVESFPPNTFGLYDTHGNVGAWCQDVWHGNYERVPTDDLARLEGGRQGERVIRGGSWYYSPEFCRSASRASAAPDFISPVVGFRVVWVPM